MKNNIIELETIQPGEFAFKSILHEKTFSFRDSDVTLLSALIEIEGIRFNGAVNIKVGDFPETYLVAGEYFANESGFNEFKFTHIIEKTY